MGKTIRNMKHIKLFEEYKNVTFVEAIESQLVPVPVLGVYVTRNSIGPSQQGIPEIDSFLKVLNNCYPYGVNAWRLPDSEEIMYIYEHQDEIGMLTEYPADSKSRDMKHHEYWLGEVVEGGLQLYFSYGAIKGTANHRWLHSAILVKEFNEAEKKKYAGAKIGKQYGI
jgi:hypothetical protein